MEAVARSTGSAKKRKESRPARDAVATRQRILDAARQHFLSAGFDQVGVREIARDAGVDPALVNRYFGGKEQLFAEAVVGPGKIEWLEAATPENLAGLMVDGIFDKDDQHGVEVLGALVRSASDPKAGAIVRRHIETSIIEPFAKLIGGGDADTRASLIVCLFAGITMMHDVLRLRRIQNDGLQTVRPVLHSMIEACVRSWCPASKAATPATAPAPAPKKPRSRRTTDS